MCLLVPALSLAQTALGLVSSEASATPVGGTIQDQGFMDRVARELCSLNIRMLMPEPSAERHK
jgi:hypothetical protein